MQAAVNGEGGWRAKPGHPVRRAVEVGAGHEPEVVREADAAKDGRSSAKVIDGDPLRAEKAQPTFLEEPRIEPAEAPRLTPQELGTGRSDPRQPYDPRVRLGLMKRSVRATASEVYQ